MATITSRRGALGSALVGALATFGLPWSALAGDLECAQASKQLEQAQAALSRATRDADTKGAAYAQCMQGGKACAPEKAAYGAAVAARSKAQAGYRAATSRRDAACQIAAQ